MNTSKMPLRIVLFLLGVVSIAFSIACIIKAGLGAPPSTSLTLTLSKIFPLTVGQFEIIQNTLYVVAQIVILKSKFRPWLLIQFPLAFILGSFIDVSMWILQDVNPSCYMTQFLMLWIGIILNAGGIALCVSAHFVALPGDNLVTVISDTYNIDFGATKVGYDVFFVIAALIVGLIGLGHVVGLREGTLIIAIVIGPLARFMRLWLEKKLYPNQIESEAP